MTIHRYIAGSRPNSPVMICDTCTHIFDCVKTQPLGSWLGPKPELFDYSKFDDAWRGAHHSQDGSFLASVASRCYICFSIHRDCSRTARKFLRTCRTYFELSENDEDRYSIKFTVELRDDNSLQASSSQVFDCLGTFKIFPHEDLPEAGIPLNITKNTFTDQCQTQIKQWLTSCEQSHHLCRDNWQTQSDFPIRLLDVGQATTDPIHLETFDGQRPHPRYVTLSHCWNHDADANKFQLTLRNRSALERPFAIMALPLKFRHAIKVARWMGVRYLWIDALCVMQDSKNDWTLQAKNVGNIYSGSYCNIAATNGDEEVGLLGTRHVDIVEPSFVPDPKSDSPRKTFILGYDDFWCNSLLDTRLHTRGWVLQERLLSPRTIHFAQEQFFFECRQCKACEAYPNGLPPQLCNWRTDAWRKGEEVFSLHTQPVHSSMTQTSRWNILKWSMPPQQTSLPDTYKLWSSTVKRYMDCSLTFEEDKLIAISGIASKIAAATRERYLAGLWDNTALPQALLWYVPTQSRADGSPSIRMPSLNKFGYRAPSWSWASMEARITWNWPCDFGQNLVDIQRTDIGGALDYGTGAIESARMHICGSLLPIKIRAAIQLEDGTPDEDGSYLIQLQPRDNAATAMPLPELDPMVYLDTPMPTLEVDAWLLPVCTQWKGRSGGVNTPVAGLLMNKAQLGEKDVFERIGIFGFDEDQTRVLCAFHGIARRGLEGLQRLQKDKFAMI